MRRFALVALLLMVATPALGQFGDHASLDRLNRRICGRVVDYSHNHGEDRRLPSAVLGMGRDLYVYLPPGYTPAKAYPLVFYFHISYIDEHAFVASDRIVELDAMIRSGQFLPAIVACVDGLAAGENSVRGLHTFYMDGILGRFETHVVDEVLPFLQSRYSIRPEAKARGILGVSAGGFGAMSIAIRRRDLFGSVATIAAPLNLRYDTCTGRYFDDFDPATYRWNERYDPDRVIGKSYFGLRRTRAATFIGPVYGDGPGVVDRVKRTNPADLLFTSGIRPGELAMYVAYPGRDNYNFDAQAQSFLAFARSLGLEVQSVTMPNARHGLAFFRPNHPPAYLWLGRQLLPPVELAVAPAGG